MAKNKMATKRSTGRGRRFPQSFWENIVDEMVAEGLTCGAAASRHGVSESAVARWARTLGKTGGGRRKKGPKSGLEKHVFVEMMDVPRSSVAAPSGYVLTLSGGVELMIPTSIRATDVIALVVGLTRPMQG